MIDVKCETCNGEGKKYLFTSHTICDACNGKGFVRKDLSARNYVRNCKLSSIEMPNFSFNGLAKVVKNDSEKIANLGKIIIPNAIINTYTFESFNNVPILELFDIHFYDVKIHIGGYHNYYNISIFYKEALKLFGGDRHLFLEIGGSSPPKNFDNSGKCLNCTDGTVYGFDSSFICEECDGFGKKLSYSSAYDYAIEVYDLYNVYGKRKKYQNDADLIRITNMCKICIETGQYIEIRTIKPPPFEFDSEFCLRKIANRYLYHRTDLTLKHLYPYIPMEGIISCPINLQVKAKDDVDVSGAFSLYNELRKIYRNAISLTLRMV